MCAFIKFDVTCKPVLHGKKTKVLRSLRGMVMKPIFLSFCSLFSTVTLHKTITFLLTLDNEPMKKFLSSQSGIMNEHKTEDLPVLRPYSTSSFAALSAPLKFFKFFLTIPLYKLWLNIVSFCHPCHRCILLQETKA